MIDSEIERLKRAIENQHGGTATHIKSSAVRETIEGRTVWEGTVHTYVLNGAPGTIRAYAWLSPIEGSDSYQAFTVPHTPQTHSPKSAVWATIRQGIETK